MDSFYFKYEGESYNALATIFNINGHISCNLSSVSNYITNEPAKFIGFELGQLIENDLPLIKAINEGLSEYLKNHPIDRGESLRKGSF
jgi:hypothetical protein